MKSILLPVFLIILISCNENDENFQERTKNEKFKIIDVSSITLPKEFEDALEKNDDLSKVERLSNLKDSTLVGGYIEIPEKFLKCLNSPSAPKGIKDLKYGVSLDAYEFKKDDQIKLGFLGFGNVNIEDNETVVVVEYKQTGTQICNNLQLFYGVGARLMMKIKSKKRSAKINTPQQISASVTFGVADVQFSIKTFGITGPGVSKLIKSGTMNEDTYVEFLKDVSELLIDAYSQTSEFVITPQPLFLKQN